MKANSPRALSKALTAYLSRLDAQDALYHEYRERPFGSTHAYFEDGWIRYPPGYHAQKAINDLNFDRYIERLTKDMAILRRERKLRNTLEHRWGHQKDFP